MSKERLFLGLALLASAAATLFLRVGLAIFVDQVFPGKVLAATIAGGAFAAYLVSDKVGHRQTEYGNG